jgi:hypothetical protein
MRRHHLDPPDGGSALDVVRRLCGVQAQVASAAALAVAVRQAKPSTTALSRAVSRRSLVRTWAMRGTLHVLAADEAAFYLSLLASARTWEKGSWQKAFHVDDVAAAKPSTAVRLLPGFDQYVLGPGTSDPNLVPPAHRTAVSRAGGWISPVVVSRGRVAGTWEADEEIAVDLFGKRVAAKPLAAEVAGMQRLMDASC